MYKNFLEKTSALLWWLWPGFSRLRTSSAVLSGVRCGPVQGLDLALLRVVLNRGTILWILPSDPFSVSRAVSCCSVLECSPS